MPLTQNDFNFFLNKVADFVKVATSEIDTLQDDVVYFRKKEAAEKNRKEKFSFALRKAAQALYESDFLTDEIERRKFLKKAEEDPAYLASVIERVCKAADVALIGSPARVATRKQETEWDPVKAKAFGWDSYSENILEDI